MAIGMILVITVVMMIRMMRNMTELEIGSTIVLLTMPVVLINNNYHDQQ